jgi:D-xylono/L-arabinono-1,4-lactonase
MPTVPELVADARCHIAEGPVWHPDEQCLYWTDVPAGKVYRWDPRNEHQELVYHGDQVGGITMQENGSLLLLGARGSVRVWRDGRVIDTILEEIPGEEDSRFNDVIADPAGRVISGTMAVRDAGGQIVRHGRLYCLDTNGELRVLLEGMGSPNGMGFTENLREMYVTDSIVGVQAIFRFDYDRATGSLRNRRMFHRTPLDGSAGRPDGMAVDVEGCLWSARWDGASVVRMGADGEERARVVLPVGKVTSVAFGGPDLTDLYITTARGDEPDGTEPGAGGIFRLRTGTRGRPEFRSRIGL